MLATKLRSFEEAFDLLNARFLKMHFQNLSSRSTDTGCLRALHALEVVGGCWRRGLL